MGRTRSLAFGGEADVQPRSRQADLLNGGRGGFQTFPILQDSWGSAGRSSHMSFAENVWSFGLLGRLLLALLLFRRLRRQTAGYHESRAVKGRLPTWVRAVEGLALFALVLAVGGLVFLAFSLFRRGGGAGHQIAGATAIYSTVGAVLIAVPLGALSANLVSWLLPPLRRANEAAMSSSQVSFASANRGLLQFGAASVPAGLIAIAVAAVAPWAR